MLTGLGSSLVRPSFILGECAYAFTLLCVLEYLFRVEQLGKIMEGLILQFSLFIFQWTCIVLCGIYLAINPQI